jgi:hypothetical protein
LQILAILSHPIGRPPLQNTYQVIVPNGGNLLAQQVCLGAAITFFLPIPIISTSLILQDFKQTQPIIDGLETTSPELLLQLLPCEPGMALMMRMRPVAGWCLKDHAAQRQLN